jgi:hypothetical protein
MMNYGSQPTRLALTVPREIALDAVERAATLPIALKVDGRAACRVEVHAALADVGLATTGYAPWAQRGGGAGAIMVFEELPPGEVLTLPLLIAISRFALHGGETWVVVEAHAANAVAVATETAVHVPVPVYTPPRTSYPSVLS